MSRRCRLGRRPHTAPGPAAPAEAGMVTAELAVALPALVLAGLLAVTGLQVASAQLRCLDAAGIAARLAARGEAAGDVHAAALAAAPRESHLSVTRTGELVSARVTVAVHLLGLGALVPPVTVSASAAEPAEPGQPDPREVGR